MGFVDNARTLPTSPTGQQQQKKRTNDVLQTADIFTRYGQTAALRIAALRNLGLSADGFMAEMGHEPPN